MIRQTGTQLGALCMLLSMPLHAQITSDGTVGTTVNQVGVQFDITGGTQISNNLFHSFGFFDVNTGETASFQGPAGIENILSRVTGGSASNIDGKLQSTISGANLYLINPAGVMFGPNASLDVQGSFHVTTADYVLLGSVGRFDASMPANTVLTASTPSAFGFVSSAPSSIDMNGSLLLAPSGGTLSVIGGNINISDTILFASGGRINIASTASAGEVLLQNNDIVMQGFSQQGDINLSYSDNIASRPISGFYTVGDIDVSGDNGGEVYIRGENFVADNGFILADTHDAGPGGKIDLVLQNTMQLSNESLINADTAGNGSGGTITASADNIMVDSGAIISAVTYSFGDAGSVELQSNNQISVTGVSDNADTRLTGNQRSKIGVDSNSFGQGGQITINADQLAIDEGAHITATATSRGNAGVIDIETQRVTVDNGGQINLSSSAAGQGGTLNMDTEQLDVLGGARIISNSNSSGSGGNINIINSDATVKVSGAADPNDASTVSAIVANAFGEADGGRIQINAQSLVLEDGGLIETALISTTASATTRAGQISVQVRNAQLDGGGQISSNNISAGQGGEINLVVSGQLDVAGSSPDGTVQSGIYSAAGAGGDSGVIDISVSNLSMDQLGTINTSTTADGNAGVIQIQSGNIDMQGGARISSSTSGSGNGGLMSIVASEDINASGIGSDGFSTGFYSDVQKPAAGQPSDASGNGGSIQLGSESMFLSDGATVSAKSTGIGNAGTINIDVVSTINMVNGATMTTASDISGGGLINTNARDMLFLSDSAITSSVADGSSNGGDITIDPVFVILDSSQIIARADAGNGGNISITTDYLLASPNSVIDASSNTGIDGQVVIDSPDDNLVASLADLPDNLLNAAALLKQRCASRASSTASSFVVTGPGGVPPQPGGLIYSSVAAGQTELAAVLKGEFSQAFLLGCSKLPAEYM